MANEVYKDDANLVSLWLLNEVSGTRYDSVGSNDLTDNNTVGSSTDAQEGDRSADFEASNNEYLSITDAAQSGLDITGDLSIVAWIKPESLVSNAVIATKYNSSSANQRSYMFWILGSSLRLNVSSDGSSFSDTSGSTALSTGDWQHVAAVYDGSELRLYNNGSLDNTPVSYNSGIYNSSAEFRLGRRVNGGRYFDGHLDEVAIFDRALSAAEVASIYNNGILEPGPLVGGKLVGGGILQGRLVR